MKVGDILNVGARAAGVSIATEDFNSTADAIVGIVEMAALPLICNAAPIPL